MGGGGGATVKIQPRPALVKGKTNLQKASSFSGGPQEANLNLVPRVFSMVLKMSSRRSKKHHREDPGMRFKGHLAVRTSLVTTTCKVSARRLGCCRQLSHNRPLDN